MRSCDEDKNESPRDPPIELFLIGVLLAGLLMYFI